MSNDQTTTAQPLPQHSWTRAERPETVAWVMAREPRDPGVRVVLRLAVDPRKADFGRTTIDDGTADLEEPVPALHPEPRFLVTAEPGLGVREGRGLDFHRLFRGGYQGRIRVRDPDSGACLADLPMEPSDQLPGSLCVARRPGVEMGFASALLCLEDLSSSVVLWYRHRDLGSWRIRRVLSITPEPADPLDLPPVLRPFERVPPLVTSLALSPDDRWLYAACWGTGEIHRYDVSDPFAPALTGVARIGGAVRRAPHPAKAGKGLNGGPRGLAMSPDGRRIYATNSFAPAWDGRIYPDGIQGWVTRMDPKPDGGLALAPELLVELGDLRPYEIRLGRPPSSVRSPSTSR